MNKYNASSRNYRWTKWCSKKPSNISGLISHTGLRICWLFFNLRLFLLLIQIHTVDNMQVWSKFTSASATSGGRFWSQRSFWLRIASFYITRNQMNGENESQSKESQEKQHDLTPFGQTLNTCYHLLSRVQSSPVTRPEEVEEEKGPGFSEPLCTYVNCSESR